MARTSLFHKLQEAVFADKKCRLSINRGLKSALKLYTGAIRRSTPGAIAIRRCHSPLAVREVRFGQTTVYEFTAGAAVSAKVEIAECTNARIYDAFAKDSVDGTIPDACMEYFVAGSKMSTGRSSSMRFKKRRASEHSEQQERRDLMKKVRALQRRLPTLSHAERRLARCQVSRMLQQLDNADY